MATFKTMILRERAEGIAPVYIRVIHNRRSLFIKTQYNVNKNGHKGNIVTDAFVLQECSRIIYEYAERLNHINYKGWDVHKVADFLRHDDEQASFSEFCERWLDNLYNEGRDSVYGQTKKAYNSLKEFLEVDDIKPCHMTSVNINGWVQSMMKTKAIKEKYPQLIRRMYLAFLAEHNDYDNGDIRIKVNPFVTLKIPKSDRTRKKAISLQELRKFFATPVGKRKNDEFAKDVCKISFCLAGINAADLYAARKEQYYDGILHYNRQKVKDRRDDEGYMEIRVPDYIMPTIKKYLNKGKGDYWLNWHEDCPNRGAVNHKIWDGLQSYNDAEITFYSFRHTWATIAQNDLGCNFDDVAFALNHVRHAVTRGYVKPKYDRIWSINERMIELVFFTADNNSQEEEKPKTFTYDADHTIEASMHYLGKKVAAISGKGYVTLSSVVKALGRETTDVIPNAAQVDVRIQDMDTGLVKMVSVAYKGQRRR